MRQFPAGFTWGSATSSSQMEEGSLERGKGLSVRGVFPHTPGKPGGSHPSDVACEHDHRFAENVTLVAKPGRRPGGSSSPNHASHSSVRSRTMRSAIQRISACITWTTTPGSVFPRHRRRGMPASSAATVSRRRLHPIRGGPASAEHTLPNHHGKRKRSVILHGAADQREDRLCAG